MRGRKAIRRRLKPVVEPRASLAANRNRIFKPGGGHERNPRTLALDHGVRTDGSPVANQHLAPSIDTSQGVQHCLAGIRGGGENFENLESAVAEIDAVGECAARIDRYAHTDPITGEAPGKAKAKVFP